MRKSMEAIAKQTLRRICGDEIVQQGYQNGDLTAIARFPDIQIQLRNEMKEYRRGLVVRLEENGQV